MVQSLRFAREVTARLLKSHFQLSVLACKHGRLWRPRRFFCSYCKRESLWQRAEGAQWWSHLRGSLSLLRKPGYSICEVFQRTRRFYPDYRLSGCPVRRVTLKARTAMRYQRTGAYCGYQRATTAERKNRIGGRKERRNAMVPQPGSHPQLPLHQDDDTPSHRVY